MSNLKITFINDEVSQDLNDVIKFAQKNKVNFIEMRSLNNKNLLDHSEEELNAIKQKLKNSGIGVSAIASPLFKWGNSIKGVKIDSFFFNVNTKPTDQKKYINKAIVSAKILETKYIRIFSGLNKSEYKFLDDPLLKYAIDLADKNDITLLLENEPVCSLDSLSKAIGAIRKIGKSNFGLWLDISNAYKMGEDITEDILTKNLDIIKYFHLKDFDFTSDKYTALGEGSINYKRVMSIISGTDFMNQPFLSIETHVKENSPQATRQSINNLRKYLKTKKRVRYAILGCGRIFPKHAKAIRNDKYSELTSVFDIIDSKTKKAAHEWDCCAAESLDAILNDKGIDCVIICTPHDSHARLIKKIVDSGKFCITEKPPCIDEKELKILEQKEIQDKTFVVLQNRYNPAIVKMLEIISNNQIGGIKYISGNVRWHRDDPYFKNTWQGRKSSSGGALFSQGFHILDIIYMLAGPAAKSDGFTKKLRKVSEVEDILSVNIIHKSGTMSHLEISTYTPFKNYESSLFIIGEKGTIKIGGRALNIFEYLDTSQNITNRILSENIDSVYGNGHDRFISRVSRYLISKEKKHNPPTIDEGLRIVELIRFLYKNTKEGD